MYIECRDDQEFYDAYAKGSTKRWIIAFIVCCYLTAIFSFVEFYWLDIIVYGVMGTWMIVKKHWLPSLIISLYCFFTVIINFLFIGSFGGWFCLLAAVVSTSRLMELSDAYEVYCESGYYPGEEI